MSIISAVFSIIVFVMGIIGVLIVYNGHIEYENNPESFINSQNEGYRSAINIERIGHNLVIHSSINFKKNSST